MSNHYSVKKRHAHVLISLLLYAATYVAIIWSLITNFKMGLVAALIFFMNMSVFIISPYWEKVG